MKIYAIYVVRNNVKPAKAIVDVKDLASFGFFQRSRYTDGKRKHIQQGHKNSLMHQKWN